MTVVNPAMESALGILQKFAFDVREGKISKDRLRFGAPWRHPPHTVDATECLQWAKLQLMDFVQSLVNAEFVVIIFISGSNFYCLMFVFEQASDFLFLKNHRSLLSLNLQLRYGYLPIKKKRDQGIAVSALGIIRY